MSNPRIIVTGNRDWACKRTVARWMIHACQLLCNLVGGFSDDDPVLIHGACGKRDQDGKATIGADVIAHDFAVEWGWITEPHLARWDLYGNAAGPIRNAEMAKAGADFALAFGALTRGQKRTGTGDMVAQLIMHNIPYIHVAREVRS
jgi:hypothetical protein